MGKAAFSSEAAGAISPRFQPGGPVKECSVSRETATARHNVDDMNTLLSPFHSFTYVLMIFPRLKPGATFCRLYEATGMVV